MQKYSLKYQSPYQNGHICLCGSIFIHVMALTIGTSLIVIMIQAFCLFRFSWLVCSSVDAVCTAVSRGLQGSSSLQYKTCLWRFHKGQKQATFKSQRGPSNYRKPPQTTPDHRKPPQTTANHPKPLQTTFEICLLVWAEYGICFSITLFGNKLHDFTISSIIAPITANHSDNVLLSM